MAMNFQLTEDMDIDTLAQVVKLREKNGLHVEYQYGLRVGGKNDYEFFFPYPKYDGCSLRVFIYNRVLSYAKVRMSLESYHNTYYSSIELYNTTVTIGHRKGWSRVPTYNYTEPIGLSKFVSIGLRINGNSIQPLVNEWVGGGFDHGTKVSDQSWIVKIYSGENYIVSLHICDEVGGSFPAYGLNQSYGSNILLPVGSYLTVFAVFVGGTTGDQDIWIGFQQDAEKWYRSVPMKTNEEFSVFVTNSTEGWLLATSFLGVNQDTAVVARNNKEQFIDVKVSNNCYIRRIVAVSAVIPEQYRAT